MNFLIISCQFTIRRNSPQNDTDIILTKNRTTNFPTAGEYISDYLAFISLTENMKYLISCDFYSFRSDKNSSITTENDTNLNKSYLCDYDNSLYFSFFFFIFFHFMLSFTNSYLRIKNLTIYSKMIKKNLNKKDLEEDDSYIGVSLSNLYDIFIHFFGNFIFDLITNRMFNSFLKVFRHGYFDFQIFIFFSSILFAIIYIGIYIFHLRKVNTLIHFSKNLRCAYDSLFAVKYGYLILFLKISISIKKNLVIIHSPKNSLFIFFENFIFAICLFFIIFICFEVKYGNIIYFANNGYNFFRLFNIIFLNFIFLSEIFLQSNYKINIFGITLLIFCLVSSWKFTKIIDNLNFENLFLERNFFYQVGFILNLKFENLKINKKLFMLIHNHVKYCKIKDCKVLSLDYDQNEDEIFLHYKKELNKYSMRKSNNNFEENLKFLCIISLLCIGEMNKNKNLLQLFFLIKNMSTSNNNNLNVMAQIHLEQLKKSVKNISMAKNSSAKGNEINKRRFITFEVISTYLFIYDDFKSSIDNLTKIMTYVNTGAYDELFLNSKNISQKKEKIFEKFQIINKYRNEYQDVYSYFLIKLIFKNIFNTELFCENEIIFPLDFDQVLKTNFNNNNFVNLIFKENNLNIIQASKNLIQTIGCDYEILFPEFYRKESKKHFINEFKNSNGTQFFIKLILQIFERGKNKKFLNYFNSQCTIFPNLSVNEILIMIKLIVLDEEILVFQEDLRYGKKHLKFLSKEISEKICLDNNSLSLNRENEITLMDIFSTKSLKKMVDENINIVNEKKIDKNYIFFIDYLKYKEYFMKYLESLKDRDFINEEEMKKRVEEFSNKLNKKDHYYKVVTYEKTEFENFIYTIYSLKPIEKGRLYFLNDNHTHNSNNTNIKKKENESKINLKIDTETHLEKMRDLHFSDYSQSNLDTQSKRINSNNFINKIFINSNNNINFKGKGLNNKILNSFHILIILILLVIVFGIVIIIIAVVKIKEIKILFDLNKNFNSLISNYYETMMNIAQNILIIPEGISNNLERPQIGYQKYYNAGVQLKIPPYFNVETITKVDFIKSFFSEVKKSFYSVKDTDLVKEILNEKIFSLFVTNKNKNLNFSIKEINFLDNFDIFISLSKIVAENPNIFTYLYLIDSSKSILDFRHFVDTDIDIYQTSAINLIINFIPMIKVIEDYKNKLKSHFYIRIDDMHTIIKLSSIFLLVVHKILIIMIIFILHQFKHKLFSNICIMDHLMQEEKLLFLKKKLKIIRNLCLMYIENPKDLILNLKNQKILYKERMALLEPNHYNKKLCSRDIKKIDMKKDQANSINKSRNTYENLKNKGIDLNFQNRYYNLISKNKNSENKKENLLDKNNIFFNILVKSNFFSNLQKFSVIFGFFFMIYFIFFYFLFESIHKENITQSQFSFLVWSNNQKIVKNGMLMNTIILLNITKKTLQKNMFDEYGNPYDYSDDINNLYNQINSINKLIKTNSNRDLIMKYFKDYINCDLIYSDFYGDVVFTLITEVYINRNKTKDFLKKNLLAICNYFPFLKEHDLFFLFEVLNSMNRNLIYKYNSLTKTYENLREIYSGQNLYDMYTIMIIILRPIRVFMRGNLILTIITNAFDSYITFIIIYLIMNFLMEIFFFLFVKIYVMMRMSKIDRDLKNSIRCLII